MIVLKRSGTAASMLVRRRSLPDEPDCFGHAARPGLAVTGKHDVRFDRLDSLERFACAWEVAAERGELRPGLPREHVQRRERVAYEEHLLCGQMQRRAALAGARDVDDTRRAGHAECGP